MLRKYFPDERPLHILILGVCVAVSVIGILFSIYWSKQVADAQRGGAIAVALAFASLFANRDYGDQVFNALTVDKPELKRVIQELAGITPNSDENLEFHFNRMFHALRKQLMVDAAGQARQNMYIALSASIGTIVWGFGDLIASPFIPATVQHVCNCCP